QICTNKQQIIQASAFDVGWPVVCVDFRSPLQELGQVGQLLIGQVELRHLATAGNTGRLRLHPCGQEVLEACFAAATMEYVAQFGGKVCTLTQQGVTAAAVVGLVNVFSANHRLCQLISIGTLGNGFLCVVCQRKEHQNEEQT